MYRNLHIVIHLAANGRCGCTRKRRKLRTPVGAESGLPRGVSCRRPVACVQCVESDALGELLFYRFAPPIKKRKCFGVFLATKQRWRYGTPFSEGAPRLRARMAGAPGSPGAENGRDQRERQTDAQDTGSFRREKASYQYRENGSGSFWRSKNSVSL